MWIIAISFLDGLRIELNVLERPLECLVALVAVHHAPGERVEVVVGSRRLDTRSIA